MLDMDSAENLAPLRANEIRLLQALLDHRYHEWKAAHERGNRDAVQYGRVKGLAEALGAIRHNTEAEELAAAAERYDNLPST